MAGEELLSGGHLAGWLCPHALSQYFPSPATQQKDRSNPATFGGDGPAPKRKTPSSPFSRPELV